MKWMDSDGWNLVLHKWLTFSIPTNTCSFGDAPHIQKIQISFIITCCNHALRVQRVTFPTKSKIPDNCCCRPCEGPPKKRSDYDMLWRQRSFAPSAPGWVILDICSATVSASPTGSIGRIRLQTFVISGLQTWEKVSGQLLHRAVTLLFLLSSHQSMGQSWQSSSLETRPFCVTKAYAGKNVAAPVKPKCMHWCALIVLRIW